MNADIPAETNVYCIRKNSSKKLWMDVKKQQQQQEICSNSDENGCSILTEKRRNSDIFRIPMKSERCGK